LNAVSMWEKHINLIGETKILTSTRHKIH
jgi:hypothetical protein